MDPPSIESIDGELFETERARRISQRMFYWGFAFLPMLWFVNVWLFWYEFRGKHAAADVTIKKFTRYSAVAFTVASVIFLPWFLLYIIAGQRILSPGVYRAIDATALNVAGLGIPSSAGS